LATLRDMLHQLEDTLERTRAGVDAITSHVVRLREEVAALGTRRRRAATSVGIDMVIDAAAEFVEAFRELDSGILDAQGDIDTLEAALADDADEPEA
jgi:phage shock protein A